MADLARDPVFTALTRPQMFAGVTYSYMVLNGTGSLILFIIFKSLWMLAVPIVLHLVGTIACVKEPRIFDLWLTRVSRNPRVRNHRLWGCNSYAP